MSGRLLAVLLAVVGIAAAGLVAGCGGDKASEVTFQNASEPGPKPFTEPTDVPKGSNKATSASTSSASTSGSDSSSSSGSGSSGSGSSSSGSGSSGSDPSGAGAQSSSGASGSDAEGQKRGAFTEPNTVCDREKLISALAADGGKLKAWADAAGVDADQQAVAEYIRKLKPSTLSRDTQVTTHSYENGEAKAYQAILRKGTAVLVDDSGKPVARCVCGNPLTEPAELEQTTKCINCPPDYKPPPPCEENCSRPEPNPPPTLPPTAPPTKPGGNVVQTGKDALDKCRKEKGSLKACEKEYEAVRAQCEKNPLDKACDSTVCFDAFLDLGAKTGCTSYIDQNEILSKCLALENTAKNACLKQARDLQEKCGRDPTQEGCTVDPKIKALKLRRKCGVDGSRPECVNVQLDCIRNPEQFGCQGLRNACQGGPDRPDCKAVQQVRLSCLASPNRPECKGLPQLPTAQGADQTGQQQDQQGTDQPGQEGTGQDPGAGGDPDAGGEGGQTPPETTPQPETPQQPGGE